MTKIICDTNIWYNLANNHFESYKIVGLQLIGTSVTVHEISETSHLVKNLDLVKRVAKAFLDYNSGIMVLNPFEYLIYLFNPGYIPNDNKTRGLLEEFRILIGTDLKDISSKNIDRAKEMINNRKKSDKEVVDYINSGLPQIRENIKRIEGKFVHRKKDFTHLWKQLISDLVQIYSRENCNKEYTLNDDVKIWNRFECFILVWEAYFKTLEIEKRNLERNDWADLINFVYVQPGDKYWTFEKKWNMILNQHSRLQKYLFEFNGK
jgi:hypothetical protein